MNEFLRVFASLAAAHWAAVGLFTVTETDILSRRVRRNLARYGPFRLFLAPLFPGGARGLFYVILNLSALWLFVVGMLWLHGAYNEPTVDYVTGLCAYAFIYLGLGCAVGRLARRISGDF